MEPYPRTWAEIDLSALKRNLSALRAQLGSGPEIALVCKADAYGHGLVPVGRFAIKNGADWLAVATVQEGVALRDAGVDSPILVMSPVLPVEIDQAVFYGLELFFEDHEVAQLCSDSAMRTKRLVKLHLKVDTGLHRFGCSPSNAVPLILSVKSLPGISVKGIAHHFVDSAFDVSKTQEQIAMFGAIIEELQARGECPPVVHQANSAGAWRFGGSLGNLARVGIMAYGVDPAGLSEEKLEPVLTWFARVTSVRNVNAGETVSYSSTFRLQRDSRIATLGIGYGDGYPRALSNQGYVSISGQMCPIVGLVCMDQMLVDVTPLPSLQRGDLAEIIGKRVPVKELAKLAGTNSHEILTRVMSRVSRRYIYPD